MNLLLRSSAAAAEEEPHEFCSVYPSVSSERYKVILIWRQLTSICKTWGVHRGGMWLCVCLVSTVVSGPSPIYWAQLSFNLKTETESSPQKFFFW
jgi:hypothetical protein